MTLAKHSHKVCYLFLFYTFTYVRSTSHLSRSLVIWVLNCMTFLTLRNSSPGFFHAQVAHRVPSLEAHAECVPF